MHYYTKRLILWGKGGISRQAKRRLPSWEAVLLRFYLAGLTMRLMSLFFTRMVLKTIMPSVAF